jgi:hypothetical protein
MPAPKRTFPPPKPKSASPADRSAEFTETQRRLKREAAERRDQTKPPVDNGQSRR